VAINVSEAGIRSDLKGIMNRRAGFFFKNFEGRKKTEKQELGQEKRGRVESKISDILKKGWIINAMMSVTIRSGVGFRSSVVVFWVSFYPPVWGFTMAVCGEGPKNIRSIPSINAKIVRLFQQRQCLVFILYPSRPLR